MEEQDSENETSASHRKKKQKRANSSFSKKRRSSPPSKSAWVEDRPAALEYKIRSRVSSSSCGPKQQNIKIEIHHAPQLDSPPRSPHALSEPHTFEQLNESTDLLNISTRRESSIEHYSFFAIDEEEDQGRFYRDQNL